MGMLQLKSVYGDDKMNKSTKSQTVLLMAGVIFLVAAPEMAFAAADPIKAGIDWIGDLLTNGIARSAAIVAIAILGYLAWFGHMTGERAIKFIAGIILVFGGASIVDLISGAVA
jgi:type IV secretion system protein VirB2